MSCRAKATQAEALGEKQVEKTLLSETIEEVSCRWCGSGSGVIELSADEAAAAEDSLT